MAYSDKTIIETIRDIEAGKMYLPAIQRKFVWDDATKITSLMDSIMCGYPIGTFLYWDVSRAVINQNKYSLYKFIHNYSQFDGQNNDEAPDTLLPGENIFAVLDGQQRLTSLNIALQGSLALRKPRGILSDPRSYPKKELYFNVKSGVSPMDEDEGEETCKYEFKFLTEEEAESTKKDSQQGPSSPVWFRVKDIVAEDFSPHRITTLARERGWDDDIIFDNLQRLVDCLHRDRLINYFAVKETTMDNVLNIFVRVNSGGVVLSHADLLFSTIVASWDKAREEIEDLLKNINGSNKRSCRTIPLFCRNIGVLRSCPEITFTSATIILV